MKALTFSRFGGPDVLEYREVADPELLPGTAIVRTAAIGLNFADIYRRRGDYHLVGKPPYIAGYEAAGTVDAVRTDPDENSEMTFKVGDRVAFADAPFANAELVRVSLDRLVPLPPTLPEEIAAAVLLQGMTADMLISDAAGLQHEDVAIVYAAAGGVGSILVQLIEKAGARVVALVSTEEKRKYLRRLNIQEVYLYTEPWVDRVVTNNDPSRGKIVFDSVGSTLSRSLQVAGRRGRVVFYGMAGGNPPAVNPRLLMDNSQSLVGADLWNVLTSHRQRLERAQRVFNFIAERVISIDRIKVVPLRDGAEAHRLLESRHSIGKVVLRPDRSGPDKARGVSKE